MYIILATKYVFVTSVTLNKTHKCPDWRQYHRYFFS